LLNGRPYVDAAGNQLAAGITVEVSTPSGAWVVAPIELAPSKNSSFKVP
jgi:hypothetical protein